MWQESKSFQSWSNPVCKVAYSFVIRLFCESIYLWHLMSRTFFFFLYEHSVGLYWGVFTFKNVNFSFLNWMAGLFLQKKSCDTFFFDYNGS